MLVHLLRQQFRSSITRHRWGCRGSYLSKCDKLKFCKKLVKTGTAVHQQDVLL